jgi:hypothetical protein
LTRYPIKWTYSAALVAPQNEVMPMTALVYDLPECRSLLKMVPLIGGVALEHPISATISGPAFINPRGSPPTRKDKVGMMANSCNSPGRYHLGLAQHGTVLGRSRMNPAGDR